VETNRGRPVRVEVYNVKSVLFGFKDDELARIRERLSTYAPGYRFTKLFKMKKWDGRVTLMKGAEIPTGLLSVVLELFPNATLTDMRGITTPTLGVTTVPLRPYQMDAVSACFGSSYYGTWWPRGIIKIGTGGGKTEIAAAMIEMAKVNTLFLVHRTELVEQAVERFEKYGISAGTITAGHLDLTNRVTVATIQSLMSFKHQVNKTKKRSDEQVEEIREKKAARGKVIRKWLMGIEQVFVDEAHLVAANLDKGNMFIQALELMPNAYMRWGLTATPFMRDDYHDWLLEGATGFVLYGMSSIALIALGYLTPPRITMYRMKTKSYGMDWVTDYEFGIMWNEERNTKIIECIEERPGPIMTLIQRVDHGKLLKTMCDKANIPVRFLYGEVSISERKQALADLKAGSIKAVIGSVIWDEGLDVAEIRTLILAGGGKSKIKNLQRLGRGLRLSKGKDEVEVIDFFEEGSKWLRRHAVQRRKLFESEGYKPNVEYP
jgi:superfamily II DNA or RNA helicase